MMFDPDQGGMRHARTFMRKPDSEKFELARIQALSATPWSLHQPVALEGVFVEKIVIGPEVSESTMKARKLYILPKDLEMFGYSPGCKKVQLYVNGNTCHTQFSTLRNADRGLCLSSLRVKPVADALQT